LAGGKIYPRKRSKLSVSPVSLESAHIAGTLCRNIYLFLPFFFQVIKYLPEAKNTDISWTLICAALSSVARTSMVTMQDILGLDSSGRMNTAATQVICYTPSDLLLV
jgi:hypothetical protein